MELDLQALDGKNPSPFEIAINYSMLGEKDHAFEWLEKAIEVHHVALDELK